MVKRALYFGFGIGGHFLRIDLGTPVREFRTLDPEKAGLPWSIGLLDGGLLKNDGIPDHPDGRVFWTCGGRPILWFAFYWWDRSGDSRGASNSGFYVEGFGDGVDRTNVQERAEAAFAFALTQWPSVVERQRHPLVLQRFTEGTR